MTFCLISEGGSETARRKGQSGPIETCGQALCDQAGGQHIFFCAAIPEFFLD
ncbi:hypothetical protein [Rhodovulum sp. MB263]|uniref:hypothetical protein n=1 Tax=Rhodovulum sp. (strain MB263) TaxID=308754 RepID=UPI0012DAF8CF|nr:hypothetical protein [Rhodovulum sp. MB263]